MPQRTMVEALNHSLDESMGRDASVCIMGEDVAEFLRLHLELTGMEATANVFVLILHLLLEPCLHD